MIGIAMTRPDPAPGLRLAGALRHMRRRVALTLAALGLAVGYLAYAWVAFDVSGLIERSDPERAVLLGTDAVAHKVHVLHDLRGGGFEVAVEGERTATYETPPDWVAIEDDGTGRVDLGEGHIIEIAKRGFVYDVPGYGRIATAERGGEIVARLPQGPRPDWLSVSARKVEARPTWDRSVRITRSRVEVHRYFWGWENFWFPFDSPLHGLGVAALWELAWSAERLDPQMSNAAFIARSFWTNPDWQHGHVIVALGETILMAVLGTLTAALVALPLAFLAARNFAPLGALRFVVRRVFDFVRGVDSLIWSLIFIRAFGLGPLTGALAIAVTDTGTFGKLFSESLENVDGRQIEGVRATGASSLQQNRFGVIPQVLPVFLSQLLYYLESNTRSATVIGALGAGGIGLVLVETIRTSRDWENTLYIILLTLIVVILMDQLSGWLRRRLIEGRRM